MVILLIWAKHEQKGFLHGMDSVFSALLKLKLKHKALQEQKGVVLTLLVAWPPSPWSPCKRAWTIVDQVLHVKITVLKGTMWNAVKKHLCLLHFQYKSFQIHSVVGRAAPKRCYMPIPGSCDYITLQGKSDFADITEAINLVKKAVRNVAEDVGEVEMWEEFEHLCWGVATGKLKEECVSLKEEGLGQPTASKEAGRLVHTTGNEFGEQPECPGIKFIP